MWAEEGFNVWKWDGCSLVDYNEICMSYFIGICWKYVLDKLVMSFEKLYSHNRSIILFIITDNLLKVKSFLESKQLQPLNNKLKQSLQIIGRRSSNKNIAKSNLNRRRNAQPNRRRLTPTSSRIQRYSSLIILIH